MNSDIDLATSRPLGVAERLAGRPLDRATVYAKLVVLTGEPEWLQTQNGHWCFVDALRLLSRVVGRLVVVVPLELSALRQEVTELRSRAWSIGHLELQDGLSEVLAESAHALLNIGSRVPNARWISVSSAGWVARLSTTAELPRPSGPDNPMAALMAASFGVAEVFKRVFEVPVETIPAIEFTEFSLFELSCAPGGVGPALPQSIDFEDALLVGGGAIGNGIVLLAAQVPFAGNLLVIDKQDFQDENLGTCILVESEGWLGREKAVRLEEWLQTKCSLRVKGIKTTIEKSVSDGLLNASHLRLVMAGLDEADPRRTVQRLWPEILVDGGINEVGAAVTQHRLAWDGTACIQCWFEPQTVDEKAVQSQVTGLRRDSLNDLNREITEADVAAAAESKREWLEACRRQRKTLCSVITEAQMAARLNMKLEEGFRPSVPFVATASAALVVAEAVKAIAFPSAPSPQQFQLGSLFLGPEFNVAAKLAPNPRCQCVVHRAAIREMRKASGADSSSNRADLRRN